MYFVTLISSKGNTEFWLIIKLLFKPKNKSHMNNLLKKNLIWKLVFLLQVNNSIYLQNKVHPDHTFQFSLRDLIP